MTVMISRKCCVITALLLLFVSFGYTHSLAQNQNELIQSHLSAGEFPPAISIANTLNRDQRNKWLATIAKMQLDSGVGYSSYETANQVDYDIARSELLNEMAEGQSGGITEADFDPLIELIQNTIDTDSWQDNGGLGTIQAYPAGVFVDPSGTLRRIRTEEASDNKWLRNKSLVDSGNRNAIRKSELRKVSIARLEKAVHILAARGQRPDQTMLNLAGIYEIKYLMVMPETGDIVIAGPAGPFENDVDGRPVNTETGKPVVQLDDLVVCLRNAWEADGKFGCSINPRKQNLANTQTFLATSKLKGNAWSKAIRQNLGLQDIEVFGIDPETHAARVLVEADYRMKLIGMGLEESIPEVRSYLDRVQLGPDGQLPPMDVVRWWFTQNYDHIIADKDRLVFQLEGSGVQVMSENEFVTAQGDRVHTGKSNAPTEGFAKDFTKHFDKLADEYPVYRQLKNVFDMALIASLIRKENLDQKVDWNRTFFDLPKARQASGKLAYRVRTDQAPRNVDSVLNDKILKHRKRGSTVKHHIVGVSGGISYDSGEVLKVAYVDDEGKLAEEAKRSNIDEAELDNDALKWWWD